MHKFFARFFVGFGKSPANSAENRVATFAVAHFNKNFTRVLRQIEKAIEQAIERQEDC